MYVPKHKRDKRQPAQREDKMNTSEQQRLSQNRVIRMHELRQKREIEDRHLGIEHICQHTHAKRSPQRRTTLFLRQMTVICKSTATVKRMQQRSPTQKHKIASAEPFHYGKRRCRVEQND